MSQATLALEDGTILHGTAFGDQTDAVLEPVFNTSMTGYQEIITDPSNYGQAVLFTIPHIGNVGVNTEDYESTVPQVSAVVVRAISPTISNWRATQSLPEWLANHGVPGISGVDTRYLTRRLRDRGTMKAALSSQGTDPQDLQEMTQAWPGLDGRDMVKEVTCPEPYNWTCDTGDKWVNGHHKANLQRPPYIALYDFGAKRNIMRHLAAWGARVTVVPADMAAADVLAMNPDGVMLSNGPGDPAGLPYAVNVVS